MAIFTSQGRRRFVGLTVAAIAVVSVAGFGLFRAAQGIAGEATSRPSAPLVPERGTLFGGFIDPVVGYTDAEVRAALLAHEADIGRKLDIAHDFQPFNNYINVGRLRWYHDNGRIPMATWNGAHYNQILSGVNDGLIRTQAQKFKQLGVPVFLRFFHEVDAKKGIGWGYEANPEKYEEVWRYVRGIFDEVGADNVVWVYAPTAWGFETGEAGLYYPGDDVVDWIGSDGYLYVPCRARDTYETFESVYQASIGFAAAHDKPLMAAEWGVGGSGDDSHKVAFYESVVQAAQDNPELAAVVYFNKPTDPDGCNWMVDTTSASLAAYAELAQHPHFNQSGRVTTTLCNGFAPTHWGTSGDDTLTGTNGADVIVGKAGSDVIYGKGGRDLICGGGGNDRIHGGPGMDVIYGGLGKDKLHGGDRNDKIYGNRGDDILRGNHGTDKLRGGGNSDGLHGGQGRDDDCNGGPSNGDYVIGGCEIVGNVP